MHPATDSKPRHNKLGESVMLHWREGLAAAVLRCLVLDRRIGPFNLHLNPERILGVIDQFQNCRDGTRLAIWNSDRSQGVPETDWLLLIHQAANVLGKCLRIGKRLRELNDATLTHGISGPVLCSLDALD